MAARDGEPPLSDPKPTIAPDVYRKVIADFNSALNPHAASTPAVASTAPAAESAAPAETAAPPTAAAAPLQLQEVPAADASSATGSAVMTNVPAASSHPAGAAGNSMGVEIVTPSTATPVPDNGGLKAVGPPDAKAVPAIEKAAGAPDQVNDIPAGSQPAAQAARADGKKTKPEFDKADESSSKHKKKKGLAKLNPF
jgi:outer membrane protein assembly factor BamD